MAGQHISRFRPMNLSEVLRNCIKKGEERFVGENQLGHDAEVALAPQVGMDCLNQVEAPAMGRDRVDRLR